MSTGSESVSGSSGHPEMIRVDQSELSSSIDREYIYM